MTPSFLLLAALAGAASPAAGEGPGLDIGQVLVTPLGDAATLPPFFKPGAIEPGAAVRWHRIVSAALSLWDVIKDNAPVVDVKKQYAAALPDGAPRWDQLQEWQPPRARKYRLVVRNLAGVETVRLEYLFIHQYGGRYQGKGRYLSGVTVEPTFINARWGYTLNVGAKAVNVANVGTAEEPVAGMTLVLDWRVETGLQKSSGAQVYFVDGSGIFRDLGAL